jgi:hypothetical protein
VGINRIAETAKVLKHTIEKFVQITTEVWKGFNQEARLYNSPGEDAVPCKGDQLILVKTDGTGKYAAVGVLTVSQGARPGEKIIYARDPDAQIVSKIAMFNDGSVNIDTNFGKAGNFNMKIKGNAVENINGDFQQTIGGVFSEKTGGDRIIDSGGKIYIGNTADNIRALLLALTDELIAFQTFGAPPLHTAHPQTIQKLNQFKEKIKALFSEGS